MFNYYILSTNIFNRFKLDISHLLSILQISSPSIFMLAIIPVNFQISYVTLTLLVMVGLVLRYAPNPILGLIFGIFFGITSILAWHLHTEDLIDLRPPIINNLPIVGITINYGNILTILNGLFQSMVFTSYTAYNDLLILFGFQNGDYTLIPLVRDTIDWISEHYDPFMEALTRPRFEIIIQTITTHLPRAFSILIYSLNIQNLGIQAVTEGENLYRIFLYFRDIPQALQFLIWDPETQAWIFNHNAYQHYREVLAPCQGFLREIRPEIQYGHWIHNHPAEVLVEVRENPFTRFIEAYNLVPIIAESIVLFLVLSTTGVLVAQLV
uniref:hypothetical protein n=1 Tax=Cubamyces menziesii TaxID=2136021 RepID=UPI00300158F2|nr:hypothetical protein [Cubamyces menziesii]